MSSAWLAWCYAWGIVSAYYGLPCRNLLHKSPMNQAMGGNQAGASALREMALVGLREGDPALAERYFLLLLEREPRDIEALLFVAARRFSRGETSRAVAAQQAAKEVPPESPDVMHQLGAAQQAAGDVKECVANLRLCLARAPQMFPARLRLGMALERLGESHDALLAYFGAVTTAQAQGRWMNDATTVPGQRQAVKHAMGYIDAARRAHNEHAAGRG